MTPTYRTLLLVLFLSLSLATLSPVARPWRKLRCLRTSATIRFSAVVQHVKGLVQRIDSKSARTPLETRSVLYDGERVHVASGANLKMITRHECVAVLFYGESTALAPERRKTMAHSRRSSSLDLPERSCRIFKREWNAHHRRLEQLAIDKRNSSRRI